MKTLALFLIIITINAIHSAEQPQPDQNQQQSQLTVNPPTNNTQTPKQDQNCLQRIWQNSFIGGLIGGGTAGAVSVASGAAISSAGFTTGGIAAGSVAAGTQAGIGLVSAGSSFASFQSLGALGQGIFGAYALPVVLGAVVIGGGAYVAYECFIE